MSKANEQFGGKGARAVTCRSCRQMPKEELLRIVVTDEVYGFLDQRNISPRNIARLCELTEINDPPFQTLRNIVLEIATVTPRKRRRWKILPDKHPDLFQRIVESELFDDILDEQFDPMECEEE